MVVSKKVTVKRKRAYSTRKYRKTRRTMRKRRTTGKRRVSRFRRKRGTRKMGLPGTRGKTEGSYGRMVNPVRKFRREHGMLRSFSPGNTASHPMIVGAPFCVSYFFVANSVNAPTQQGYLPASFNLRPPDGLDEQVYSKYYTSNVMWSSIGIRITKADQNADYGPIRVALTPMRYSDHVACLTAAPGSVGAAWQGATPQAQYANQVEHPHTREAKMMNGATSSGIMNNTYIRNSVRPDYVYTEPNWQSLVDGNGKLLFTETLAVGITTAAQVIWVLTFYHERPTTTSSALFTVDVAYSSKIKAWDPIPAFLITENEKKREAAVPLPTKPELPLLDTEDDEMASVNREMSFQHIQCQPPVPPPRPQGRHVSFSPRI